MSELQQFFTEFEQQNFSEAATAFKNLDEASQQKLLKELYYEARNAKSPIAVGVLYRRLHENKEFNDFYNAWLPPIEYTKPFSVGNKKYYHYANIPTRVINAINIDDPKEIISIGMMWGTEEEAKHLLEQVAKVKSNQIRHDNIADVADKISSKIYYVKADTELGN